MYQRAHVASHYYEDIKECKQIKEIYSGNDSVIMYRLLMGCNGQERIEGNPYCHIKSKEVQKLF